MTLVSLLLIIVAVFAVAWLAHYVITTFLPAQLHMPALLIVGVLILIVVLGVLLPGASGIKVW